MDTLVVTWLQLHGLVRDEQVRATLDSMFTPPDQRETPRILRDLALHVDMVQIVSSATKFHNSRLNGTVRTQGQTSLPGLG